MYGDIQNTIKNPSRCISLGFVYVLTDRVWFSKICNYCASIQFNTSPCPMDFPRVVTLTYWQLLDPSSKVKLDTTAGSTCSAPPYKAFTNLSLVCSAIARTATTPTKRPSHSNFVRPILVHRWTLPNYCWAAASPNVRKRCIGWIAEEPNPYFANLCSWPLQCCPSGLQDLWRSCWPWLRSRAMAVSRLHLLSRFPRTSIASTHALTHPEQSSLGL